MLRGPPSLRRYTYDDGAVASHRGAKVLGGVCRVHKERAHAFMAVKHLAARPQAGSSPGRAKSSPGQILFASSFSRVVAPAS